MEGRRSPASNGERGRLSIPVNRDASLDPRGFGEFGCELARVVEAMDGRKRSQMTKSRALRLRTFVSSPLSLFFSNSLDGRFQPSQLNGRV